MNDPATLSAPSPAPNESKPKTRIVVIEDHPVVRDGLVGLLGAIPDFEIVGASGNALDAKRIIFDEKPDVVVSDLMLGGNDALFLFQEIHTELPDTRILVLSMMNEAVYAERAMRAGAVGYVMKSAETSELVRAIRSVIEGRIFLSPRIFVSLFRGLLKRSSFSAIPGSDGLSDRELQVFQLLGAGLPNREIATEMGVSVKTVESHRENLKSKLGITNAQDLTEAATNFVKSVVL